MRRYPAIMFSWPHRPDEAEIERLTAHLDNGSLLAVDDRGVRWTAFFSSGSARDQALRSLAGTPHAAHAGPLDVDDDDWAERSQANVRPITVGRLIVSPPWYAADARSRAQPDARVIVIRPSMGFGTGHHASTRRCLSLLQSIELAGRSVLDVGTGSGVLALAAWALGAATVSGVEPDPDALASARDNIALNGASGIRLVEGDLASIARDIDRYDVVLANLTGATIIGAAGRLAALARQGGHLIASGLESGEEPGVIAALVAAGWHETVREIEEGWVGLGLERVLTSPIGSRAS